MMDEWNWQGVCKVLCIRLDNMGDVLMTTPAIRALKQAHVERKLTLLASSSGARLGPFLPDVDRVIAYDAPWVRNDIDDRDADWHIIQTLQREKFDAAVIFTVYSQNPLPAALMCRLAGIPRVLAHCRENPYRLLSNHVAESEPEHIRHETQRQIDLVRQVGAYCSDRHLSFVTRATDRLSLYQKLDSAGLSRDTRVMVAHCGASAASRRYPAASFAAVFRQLGPRAGPIVLTGDASEAKLTQKIKKQCGDAVGLIDLAGRLDLGELACLIEDAHLLLSNNTGPVHIAAAVGTPVVDLYALTNPQHTPWMVPHRLLYHDVPCKYCYRSICPEGHHQCLRGVNPQAVTAAVIEMLAQSRCGQRWTEEREQENSVC